MGISRKPLSKELERRSYPLVEDSPKFYTAVVLPCFVLVEYSPCCLLANPTAGSFNAAELVPIAKPFCFKLLVDLVIESGWAEGSPEGSAEP